MKTFLKALSVLAAFVSLQGCVTSRIVRQDANGNIIQQDSSYLTAAEAERALRIAGDLGNEHDAIKVDGENGFPVSLVNTNGGVNTGYDGMYGAYGYGNNAASRYSAQLDQFDAVPPITNQNGGSNNGTGAVDPDLTKKVDGLTKDVRGLQKDRVSQKKDDTAAATNP